MTIEEVWTAIENGQDVFWKHEGYKVYADEVAGKSPYVVEFQTKHFTYKNGKVLSIRFIANYFGGLMDERELGNLFVKGK